LDACDASEFSGKWHWIRIVIHLPTVTETPEFRDIWRFRQKPGFQERCVTEFS
jgi:hypothetical protein